jgi:hypothetical protein
MNRSGWAIPDKEVKVMRCRDIRFELHELADGSLPDDRTAAISGHLSTCPLCRDELDFLKKVRNGLGGLPRPEMGNRAVARLKALVVAELSPSYGYPSFRLVEGPDNWWQKWFMPTTIGTFASVVFGVLLLGVILLPANVPMVAEVPSESVNNGDPMFLANIGLGDQFITPQDFARSRGDVSPESPSINPAGTLVEMANSNTGTTHREEEVVVVADVYRDGEARIADVVESSRDKRRMERLQAAFRADRFAPPFVPATLDNRSDVVRVILKFQQVNVNIDADNSFR